MCLRVSGGTLWGYQAAVGEMTDSLLVDKAAERQATQHFHAVLESSFKEECLKDVWQHLTSFFFFFSFLFFSLCKPLKRNYVSFFLRFCLIV